MRIRFAYTGNPAGALPDELLESLAPEPKEQLWLTATASTSSSSVRTSPRC